MNTPVSFEIAKLLKEKKFKQKECPSYLLVDFSQTNTSKTNPENIGIGDLIGYYVPNKTVNAPTIAEVVCWIYSKYQIWIQVSILKDNEWHYSIRRKYNNWNIEFPTKEKYISIENAYEKGINVVLNTYKPKS